MHSSLFFSFFFFNDTATTEIYPLSLHDALPIYLSLARHDDAHEIVGLGARLEGRVRKITHGQRLHELGIDRKSTRLNSSHQIISYAVFCLKKKKKKKIKTNKILT